VGVSTRQVGQWLRIFRNKGLEELCTLHYSLASPVLPIIPKGDRGGIPW
jgi:hypothetical protein